MEQLVKSLGFESLQEFHKLVASVDLSTYEKQLKFKDWQDNGGTKEKLLKVING